MGCETIGSLESVTVGKFTSWKLANSVKQDIFFPLREPADSTALPVFVIIWRQAVPVLVWGCIWVLGGYRPRRDKIILSASMALLMPNRAVSHIVSCDSNNSSVS